MNMILLFHLLLVVGLSLRIFLRSNLSPPARMAWFMVLLLLPYAGALIYFLSGENDLSKSAERRAREIQAVICKQCADWMGDTDAVVRLIKLPYRPAFRFAASVNGFHPTEGNTAELMPTADEAIRRMVADIDLATDHIHVSYYIWLNDGTGTALADALINAAHRGVACRALADGLGSRAMIHSLKWAEMAAAGVQTVVALPFAHPVRALLKGRIDIRNHRKITVVDGVITYCGSRNSADPEFRIKPKFAPWVDILMRFSGPVVAQNQLLFASDWMQATGEDFKIPAPGSAPSVAGSGTVCAQVFGDGPSSLPGATPQLFAALAGIASDRITLTTPYFVPDALVMGALVAAARRGVAVEMIFPARNDSWIVAAASRSYYLPLLEAGCRIYEFRGGLLHAKTLTIDDDVSLIGSSNLDLRSFDLNYENNILLQDKITTQEIIARQQVYLTASVAVTLQTVRAWPVYRRLWNNIIATLGPVL